MQLGMVGLGRMGSNMVRRLMGGGHECIVFDIDSRTVEGMAGEGATGAQSIEDLVKRLQPPRAVWVMVPAGEITDRTIAAVGGALQSGDVVIDGGNSYFKDDVRRAGDLSAQGVKYVDVGTSGGIWGLERGYSMMIGGDVESVNRLDPIFKTLSPGRGEIPRTPGREALGGTAEAGYVHCGPVGAGHFVKMVHNGIEYGLMQAYAEGFDIMRSAGASARPSELPLRLESGRRRRGVAPGQRRVILVARLDGGGARRGPGAEIATRAWCRIRVKAAWTVMTAVEEAVPADVLSAALYARFRSRQDHTFAEKVLSAMREKFGGHVEPGSAAKK